MDSITFFNNKGGVGKTSLVYHLAWMFSEMGKKVLVADLDPQENLTSMFLKEEHIENLKKNSTIYGMIEPLKRGIGDIDYKKDNIIKIQDKIYLIAGDLKLSEFEDDLSSEWPNCLDRKEKAFRITTSLYRIINNAYNDLNADIVLIDVGPNFGAINRVALIASKYVVIPLSTDLFSIRGVENVGPKLRSWREEWEERKNKLPNNTDINLPEGLMKPVGYIVSRYSVRSKRPIQSFKKWLDRAPHTYSKYILDFQNTNNVGIDDDMNQLATLKDYRSLMPMAQEVNKPMFLLTPADGAIAGHQSAVKECYEDFNNLAHKIIERISLSS